MARVEETTFSPAAIGSTKAFGFLLPFSFSIHFPSLFTCFASCSKIYDEGTISNLGLNSSSSLIISKPITLDDATTSPRTTSLIPPAIP